MLGDFRDLTDQTEEKTATRSIVLDSFKIYIEAKNEETGELDESAITEPFARVFVPTFDQSITESYERRRPRLGPQDPAYIPLWVLTSFKPDENKMDAKKHYGESPEVDPLLDGESVQVSDEGIKSVAQILADTLVIYEMIDIDTGGINPRVGLLGANRADLKKNNPNALRVLDTFIDKIMQRKKNNPPSPQ